MKTLAIIPCYNEVDAIGPLIDRFSNVPCDLVVVDDGSTDGSQTIIAQKAKRTVRHSVRVGVGKAIQDGIREALANNYEAVVVMAGNGKDDPLEVPKLMAALEEGNDYIQGSRFLKGGEWKNLPKKRWFAIKGFTWLWRLCTGHWLTDVTNGFRAYRTSFLRRPEVRWDQEWLQTYELEFYLQYKALKTPGIRFREIAVTKNYPRTTEYTKIRPGMDWLRIIRPVFLLMFGLKK
jgi:dolichol-phosphate mannosyltransferase